MSRTRSTDDVPAALRPLVYAVCGLLAADALLSIIVAQIPLRPAVALWRHAAVTGTGQNLVFLVFAALLAVAGSLVFGDRGVTRAIGRAALIVDALLVLLLALYSLDTWGLVHYLPPTQHGRFYVLAGKTIWLVVCSGIVLYGIHRVGRRDEAPAS